MNKIAFIFVMLIAVGSATSCFREDDLVDPHQSGEGVMDGVKLGETYSHQVYYDLFDEAIKASNHIEDWDLAFDSQENEWDIYLNSSRMMYACNSGKKDFADVTAGDANHMMIDASNGDSTAIGKWYHASRDTVISNDYVYIIDMGQNANSQQMGLIKIQVKAFSGKYVIQCAKIDGSGEQVHTIQKSLNHRKVYFSVADGQVNIAPEQDNWSLLFTRYTTLLHAGGGVTQDYLVTGVLLNPYHVSVAIDTVSDFEDIALSDTSHYIFSTKSDQIGYDWKYYDFDNGIYAILTDRFYIVKDYHGLYYKLRFIDFYSADGLKGSPQFEFVKL